MTVRQPSFHDCVIAVVTPRPPTISTGTWNGSVLGELPQPAELPRQRQSRGPCLRPFSQWAGIGRDGCTAGQPSRIHPNAVGCSEPTRRSERRNRAKDKDERVLWVLEARNHRKRTQDALDLRAVACAGRMARQPSQVVGIALRKLFDGLARVVTEVDAARVERRVGGTLVTWTDRKAAFAVDVEAPMLA